MKSIAIGIALLMLSGCATHYTEIRNEQVVMFLKALDAEAVYFECSLDGYKPRLAEKTKGGVWRIDAGRAEEFSYYYRVDGVVLVPDCKFKENDDFGGKKLYLHVQHVKRHSPVSIRRSVSDFRKLKSTLVVVCVLLFSVAAEASDQGGDLLSDNAPVELKEGVAQMISAGIPEKEAVEFTHALWSSRMESKHVLAAQNIVLESHRKGLPAKPLVNKAYEGLSKKVAPESIVAAMKKVRARYEFSYSQIETVVQRQQQKKTPGRHSGLRHGSRADSRGCRRDYRQPQSQVQDHERSLLRFACP